MDNKIQNSIKNSQGKPKLEQINIINKTKPNIDEAKNTSFVLYAINNNFNYQIHHTKYDKYINTLNNLKDNLNIKIISNTKDSLYKEYLKNLLTKNNYKISSNSKDVIINISNNIRYSVARAWQIAKVTTTLNITTNNKTISNHTINTIGRSSSTKQNALDSSAKQFKAKIEKIGLDKLLFGE